MSYCRFSSDSFRSDVYVYANVSGAWTTHVATVRMEHPDGKARPEEVSWADHPDPAWPDRFVAAHQALLEWLNECAAVAIGLPFDGDSFDDAGPGECAERLKTLRDAGYHIPNGVIESLEEEARERG